VLRALAAGLAVAGAAAMLLRPAPARRVIQLPAGAAVLTRVEANTEVYGSPRGTVLTGPVTVAGDNVYLHDFTIDGPRAESTQELPAWNQPFAGFTRGNGIIIEGRRGVTVRKVRVRNVAGFAILVSRSRDITIDHVRVDWSGSYNATGRNNTTGGILLEEGTTDFRVTRCEMREVHGNGIWTHSLYTSPRNARGLIEGNRFDLIGRDAIQVGHATRVAVIDNLGSRIGWLPADAGATPVAIDTAGNVDASLYAGNRFRDINGKCIDLDGFHDGEVRGNGCLNVGGYGIVMNNTNPDMQSRRIRIVDNLIENSLLGGVFVIGSENLIAHNRLLNLNILHCNERARCTFPAGEPDMLRSGIYLGKGAERPAPARGNLIEGNVITGYKMPPHSIGMSPSIRPEWNTVK
jgi:hypothetical protein